MVELVEVRKDVRPSLSLCTQHWAQFQLGRLGIVGVVDEHNQKSKNYKPHAALATSCANRDTRGQMDSHPRLAAPSCSL